MSENMRSLAQRIEAPSHEPLIFPQLTLQADTIPELKEAKLDELVIMKVIAKVKRQTKDGEDHMVGLEVMSASIEEDERSRELASTLVKPMQKITPRHGYSSAGEQ